VGLTLVNLIWNDPRLQSYRSRLRVQSGLNPRIMIPIQSIRSPTSEDIGLHCAPHMDKSKAQVGIIACKWLWMPGLGPCGMGWLGCWCWPAAFPSVLKGLFPMSLTGCGDSGCIGWLGETEESSSQKRCRVVSLESASD